MVRKSIFFSDFTGREITGERQSVTITLKFGDGRRANVVADAHVDDPLVKEIAKVGRQQARRGRPRKPDGES